MAKNMMDLNLCPDLEEAQELKYEAEMDMIKAHNAIMRLYKSFGKYIDKLGLIKAEIPDNAFKIEKEDYGNLRDKPKVSQPTQNGSSGQKKPQLHAPQVDQRQAGVVARGGKEKKSTHKL